jgi:hypothetical protein
VTTRRKVASRPARFLPCSRGPCVEVDLGAALLALLRATRGPVGAQALVALSVLFWIVLSAAVAARRLGKADL